MRRSTLRLAFLLLLLTADQSRGQTGSGAIQGTVKDATGAVVPGVTAMITHAQTARQYTTTSNEVGFYLFPSVQLGQYEITANTGIITTQFSDLGSRVMQLTARLSW